MSLLNLKVNSKNGVLIVKHFTGKDTMQALKLHLSSIAYIPLARLEILSGFPPKPLDCSGNVTLSEAQIKSGDTLVVKDNELLMPKMATLNHTLSDGPVSAGPLLRKVVPADNSCLFTSVGFVMGGKIDTSCGNYMRKIIAEQVTQDQEGFSEAILGKPNAEYCRWILKNESWGGAIEVSILANFYGLEIAVIDTVNAVINRFGEDKNFTLRAFLIFDGIHYDPVFRETLDMDGSIQTLFPTSDLDVLAEAEELAREANSSKQYTDTNRFVLTCLICRKQLVGQQEAQLHAKNTGHTNFGEVPS